MNSKIKSALSIVAVGTLVLSLGTGTFASTHGRDNEQGDRDVSNTMNHRESDWKDHHNNGVKMNKGMYFDTAALQTAGLLTPAQVTSIDAFIVAQQAAEKTQQQALAQMTKEERQAYKETQANTVKSTFAQDLVLNKILTQAEMDKITTYLQGQQVAKQVARLTNIITPYVNSGLITQAKADQVIAFAKTYAMEHQAAIAALQGKTDAQIKAYLETAGVKADLLTSMVNAKIITQAQADLLTNLYSFNGRLGHGMSNVSCMK